MVLCPIWRWVLELAEHMSERRRTSRQPVRVPVRFRIVKEGIETQISEVAEAMLRDLSLEGLAIETSRLMVDGLHISYNEHPSQKNRIFLKWELPSGRPVRAVGQTVWFERVSTSETLFVVGLRFEEISEEDRRALQAFLKADHAIPI